MSIKITCKTPSTGKPLNILLSDVPATFTTIAESPYYSIPDASVKYPVRDPKYPDNSRALREGEIFFVTPLSVRNKGTESKEIEVRIVTEPQTSTEVSKIVEFSKIVVPAGDTALIPLQGRSLFKRDISLKIVATETSATLSVETASARLVETNISTIVDNMWSDLVDNGYVTGWSSEDQVATRRDAAILLNCIKSVLLTAAERPMLDFARALYDSTGTSYIQSDKKDAFLYSWDFINTAVNAITGMSSSAKTIVTELITALKATVNASSHTLDVTVGDILQVRAESANIFDVWISGEEKPSNEHVGVISIITT